MYEIIVQLIGPVPIEFEFIYGIGTLVGCIFGVLLLFTPVILALKLVD